MSVPKFAVAVSILVRFAFAAPPTACAEDVAKGYESRQTVASS